MTTFCARGGDWSPHVPDCVGKPYVDTSAIGYLPFETTFLYRYSFRRGFKYILLLSHMHKITASLSYSLVISKFACVAVSNKVLLANFQQMLISCIYDHSLLRQEAAQ